MLLKPTLAAIAAFAAMPAVMAHNVALYWGQNSAGTASSQQRLANYCQDSTSDIIILSFLNTFYSTGNLPSVNFANGCNDGILFPGTQLLACPTIAEDIVTCQNAGKKVLLSLGGAAGVYGFTDDTQASAFADEIWNLFGNGESSTRPFGTAVVDGFDLDIEGGGSTGYAAFSNQMRTHYNADTSGKQFYMSAAPQCFIPDAYLSDAIANSEFDFLFVQFYNNWCGMQQWTPNYTNTNFNFDEWDTIAKSSPNPNVKVFLGVPASPTAAGSGYTSIDTVLNAADYLQGHYSSFGGIMMWDASQAYNNINATTGLNFAQEAKLGLVNVPSSSSSASPSIASSASSVASSSSSVASSASSVVSSASSVVSSASSVVSSASSVVSSASSVVSSASSVVSSASSVASSASSGIYSASSIVSSASSDISSASSVASSASSDISSASSDISSASSVASSASAVSSSDVVSSASDIISSASSVVASASSVDSSVSSVVASASSVVASASSVVASASSAVASASSVAASASSVAASASSVVASASSAGVESSAAASVSASSVESSTSDMSSAAPSASQSATVVYTVPSIEVSSPPVDVQIGDQTVTLGVGSAAASSTNGQDWVLTVSIVISKPDGATLVSFTAADSSLTVTAAVIVLNADGTSYDVTYSYLTTTNQALTKRDLGCTQTVTSVLTFQADDGTMMSGDGALPAVCWDSTAVVVTTVSGSSVISASVPAASAVSGVSASAGVSDSAVSGVSASAGVSDSAVSGVSASASDSAVSGVSASASDSAVSGVSASASSVVASASSVVASASSVVASASSVESSASSVVASASSVESSASSVESSASSVVASASSVESSASSVVASVSLSDPISSAANSDVYSSGTASTNTISMATVLTGPVYYNSTTSGSSASTGGVSAIDPSASVAESLASVVASSASVAASGAVDIASSAAVASTLASSFSNSAASTSTAATVDPAQFYDLTEGGAEATYSATTGLYTVTVTLYLTLNSGATLSSGFSLNDPNASLTSVTDPTNPNRYILTYITTVNSANNGVAATTQMFKREAQPVCINPFNISFNITLPDGTVVPVVAPVNAICVPAGAASSFAGVSASSVGVGAFASAGVGASSSASVGASSSAGVASSSAGVASSGALQSSVTNAWSSTSSPSVTVVPTSSVVYSTSTSFIYTTITTVVTAGNLVTTMVIPTTVTVISSTPLETVAVTQTVTNNNVEIEQPQETTLTNVLTQVNSNGQTITSTYTIITTTTNTLSFVTAPPVSDYPTVPQTTQTAQSSSNVGGYNSTIILPTAGSNSTATPVTVTEVDPACPIQGATCLNEGELSCNGYDYGQCTFGKWVVRACAPGTACKKLGSGPSALLYCDYAYLTTLDTCSGYKTVEVSNNSTVAPTDLSKRWVTVQKRSTSKKTQDRNWSVADKIFDASIAVNATTLGGVVPFESKWANNDNSTLRVKYNLNKLNTTNFDGTIVLSTMDSLKPIPATWSVTLNTTGLILTSASRGQLVQDGNVNQFVIKSIPYSEVNENMAVVIPFTGIYA